MNTSERLTLIGLIVAVLAVLIPLAMNHWYRSHDRKLRISAKANPHVFLDGGGSPLLYGMAVELTSLGQEAAEVVNVRLRLHGVDVVNSFLQGFSGTTVPLKPSTAKSSETGIEIALRLEHEGKLILNSEDSKGIKISKNHSVRFFTPLPLQPFDVQKLFDTANGEQVSIVANILPEKNKVLLKGVEVLRTIRACLKAYHGKPHDPRYEWTINVFTVSTTPSDPWPTGKLNDLPIQLKNEASNVPNRSAPPLDEVNRDVLVANWRCEALREVNLSLQELIAVPRDLGGQFHPQELMLPEFETKHLLRTFTESIQRQTGFQMSISVLGDQRPLTLTFVHDGTAAFAIFSFNSSDNIAAHMHGLLALLPRRKPEDDVRILEAIKNFACLKDIPDRAFARAMSDIAPIAAMFYADIGSANYPPLYAIMKILVAAFFITPSSLAKVA